MDHLNLKGFDSVFSTTLNNEIQDNVVEFLDWALLQKGNYHNVTLGEMSVNNIDMSRLRLSSNKSYPSGVAWEGFRHNWVWQSGISYNPPPLVGTNHSKPGVSGIYVNNSYVPSTSSGTYAHKIDYFNGRVLFNNPVPTGTKVQAQYSYKYINVLYANNLPWIREVQYRTSEPSINFVNNQGEYAVPSEARVQLPAIAVEVVPRRTITGYQLGGGQLVETDLLFHCLAEDEFTRNKLVDIISLQNEKTILMFNSNAIAQNSKFPMDYAGVPVSGALRYPDLVNSFYRGKLRFKNSNVQNMYAINSNFYTGIVRLTAETIELTI